VCAGGRLSATPNPISVAQFLFTAACTVNINCGATMLSLVLLASARLLTPAAQQQRAPVSRGALLKVRWDRGSIRSGTRS